MGITSKVLGLLLAASLLHGGEMVAIRKSEERGHADRGWLISHHTFSFADYHDPAHMHFRTLRVINEDTIAPQKGFATHPHKDMEILTYVLEGTLEHKDTLGNTSQITAGEFQLMSAGRGVEHSEYNASNKEKAHLLQIWILPAKKGAQPRYQQKSFAAHREGLKLVVAPDGAEGALAIQQDAKIYLGRFTTPQKTAFPLAEKRHAWIQVTKGEITVDGLSLRQGDGARLSGAKIIGIETKPKAEFLLFDLN